VDVAIQPWEVSIARGAPPADSALNHLAGTVRSVFPVGNRMRVTIAGHDGTALTGEVTRESAERLGLREGEPAVASFKATATRLLPAGGERQGS